jgi:hypothetical protein
VYYLGLLKERKNKMVGVTAKDVNGDEIKAGDNVVVLHNEWGLNNNVGQRLVVSSIEVDEYYPMLSFEGTDIVFVGYRVKVLSKEGNMQDFKKGDKVIVVDALGHHSSYVGQELTIKSYLGSYARANLLLLKFEEVEWSIFSGRVEKLGPIRHPRADLIHLWVEDTDLEFEQSVVGSNIWKPLRNDRVLLDTRFKLDVRVKVPQSPAQAEKESILASLQELEQKHTTELVELHKRLKSLEV